MYLVKKDKSKSSHETQMKFRKTLNTVLSKLFSIINFVFKSELFLSLRWLYL